MSNRRAYSFSLVSALADRVFVNPSPSIHPEHRRRVRPMELSLRTVTDACTASASAVVPLTGGRSS